jgi:saccharopine dehydrogenase (NADP+, L-glutamate forming)
LIVLQHRFVIEHADGKKEIRTSTLIKSGKSELSAMAQCVGYTVAIAAQVLYLLMIYKCVACA